MTFSHFARSWSLFLEGEKIPLPGARLHFNIVKTIDAPLNWASFHIFDERAVRYLLARSYKTISLNAGYPLAQRQIFTGTIERVQQDTFHTMPTVSLFASDGLYARRAFLNETLAAGLRRSLIVERALNALSFKKGFIESDDHILSRNIVLSGSVHTILDAYVENIDAHWSIQNQRLQILEKKKSIPHSPLFIQEKDFVGSLRKTDVGASFTCFLNPALYVGASVRCDGYNNLQKGTYKIIKIHFQGDSHQTPWYAHVDCIEL